MNDDALNRTSAESLVPPLPRIQYVEEPTRIERFMVLLYPNGRIVFKGSREDIDRFVEQCAERGLDLNIEGVSLCG